MRVGELHVRALLIARHVWSGKELTSKVLRDEFGMSPAQAKRVLLDVERTLPVSVEFRFSARGRPPQRVLKFAS